MREYFVLVLVGVVVGGMALLAGYSPVMGAPAKEIIIGNLQDISGPNRCGAVPLPAARSLRPRK